MANYNWQRILGAGLSSRFASLTCFGGRDLTRSACVAETQNGAITFWDSDKKSGFMRLDGLRYSMVTQGEATINFPNNVLATAVNVTHGLVNAAGSAVTPTNVLLTPTWIGSGTPWTCFISAAPNTTQFQIDGRRDDGAAINGNVTCYWQATYIA